MPIKDKHKYIKQTLSKVSAIMREIFDYQLQLFWVSDNKPIIIQIYPSYITAQLTYPDSHCTECLEVLIDIKEKFKQYDKNDKINFEEIMKNFMDDIEMMRNQIKSCYQKNKAHYERINQII